MVSGGGWRVSGEWWRVEGLCTGCLLASDLRRQDILTPRVLQLRERIRQSILGAAHLVAHVFARGLLNGRTILAPLLNQLGQVALLEHLRL